MDELTILKSKSYDICINARLSKTGVESLLRQRERLKSLLFVEYRKKCSSDKMAEHLAKADYRLQCEITRSEIATKREELKNGI